jgi:hypothetical protein
MAKDSRDAIQSQGNGQAAEGPPAPPLFPPHATEVANIEVPTKRAVWRIALTSVAVTIALVGLVGGGYAFYHDKTTEISSLSEQRDSLTDQRESLQATNAGLTNRLTTTRGKLKRANFRLTNKTKGLIRAKRNLTKLGKDLAAANARADANYSAGYSSGSSEGYSSGVSAGIVQGSDSLNCSDDADVYWLPACNW